MEQTQESQYEVLSHHWDQLMKQYKFLEVLGKGTFGQVIKAKNRKTKQLVAIKFVKTNFNNLVSTRAILREVSLLRQLSSSKNSYVTNLIDVIISSDEKVFSLAKANGLFIVIEYFESDLKKFIHADIKLSEEHIIIIVYNTLCALNYIHSSDVMHRDIKPANILVNPMCQIRLCDFGLARTVNSDKDSKKLGHIRRLSNHVSSRWYRAPEVILLDKQYNTKVDVWGLGCILAEMCTRI